MTLTIIIIIITACHSISRYGSWAFLSRCCFFLGRGNGGASSSSSSCGGGGGRARTGPLAWLCVWGGVWGAGRASSCGTGGAGWPRAVTLDRCCLVVEGSKFLSLSSSSSEDFRKDVCEDTRAHFTHQWQKMTTLHNCKSIWPYCAQMTCVFSLDTLFLFNSLCLYLIDSICYWENRAKVKIMCFCFVSSRITVNLDIEHIVWVKTLLKTFF